MAKVRRTPGAPKFKGSIGDMTYYERNGQECVKGKSERDPNMPWTPGQVESQKGFRSATAYAKSVLGDPKQKSVYEAVAKFEKRAAYHRAISDALNKPAVLQIDASAYTGQSSQAITVKAKDDFEVVSVDVLVREPSGNSLEHGTATLASKEAGDWVYTTTTLAPVGLPGVIIEVTVADRPGNKAIAKVDHLLQH
jgi:hypothetical protein